MNKEDTLYAIKQVKGVNESEFTKMNNDDLKILINFFIRNKEEKLKIWEE